MFESVKEDWKPVLSDFEHSEAGKKIEQLLAKQKAEGLKIFPAETLPSFRASFSGRGQGSYSRTGSLSWIQPSKRTGILRK